MSGFRVTRRSEEFVPELEMLPEFSSKDCISSLDTDKPVNRIYLMPSAIKEMDKHIHWGKIKKDNLVEQGGYMIGNVYQDPFQKVLFAIVIHMVPIYGAVGTATYLDMGADATYDAVLREKEIIDFYEGNVRRVGWYHTHPGGLPVFMSGTDMMTQTRSYYKDWQFAVVLNPQRRIWKGFCGAEAKKADCIWVQDKE